MLIIAVTQLVIPEHKKGHSTHLTELPPKCHCYSLENTFICRPKIQHTPNQGNPC